MPAGSSGGRNVIDMTGQKIGVLTVIRRASDEEKRPKRRKLAQWFCECVCGKTCIAVGTDLRSGKVKTCGCRTSIVSRRNFQGYKEIGKGFWRTAVQNASQRDYEFSIDIEFAWELFLHQDRKCAISGIPLTLDRRTITASIDRIDNTIGYTKENIQWVHKDINKLKGTMTMDRLVELCQAVAIYQTNN